MTSEAVRIYRRGCEREGGELGGWRYRPPTLIRGDQTLLQSWTIDGVERYYVGAFSGLSGLVGSSTGPVTLLRNLVKRRWTVVKQQSCN